jgi:hypothetical protein
MGNRRRQIAHTVLANVHDGTVSLWTLAVITCAFGVAAAYWLGNAKGNQTAYKEYATYQAKAEAEHEFYSRCSILATRKEVIDCAVDAAKSARETQRSEEDVDAQKQMAAWALAMLVISSILGFLTLIAAFVSVVFVRNTLLETRRIGRAETRAYLSIKGNGYSTVGGYITLNFIIKNSGSSPAKNVKATCILRAFVESKTTNGIIPYFEYIFTPPLTIDAPDVQAGGERPISIDFDQDSFSASEWFLIRDHISDGQMFYSKVILAWTDVFEDCDGTETFFVTQLEGSDSDEEHQVVFHRGTLSEGSNSFST